MRPAGLLHTAVSACCRVARMERDARDSAGRCAALEQEFPWIAGERQLFGCAQRPHALLQMAPKQALLLIIRGAVRSA